MEFHVLELPKLPKPLDAGGSNIELWARFINAERKEEFDMLATQNPYIEKAYEKLQVISQDKEKRMEFEFTIDKIILNPDHILGNIKNKLTPGAKDSTPYSLLPFGNPALSFTS